MIWADQAILAIIGVSALISIFRGLIREVLSLLAWVLAVWVSITFMHSVAERLTGFVSVPSARLALGFFTLFVVTLLAGGICNFFIGKLVASTGLSGTDRALGILFGIARGGAIVALLVLLAGLTPLPRDPWWGKSLFIPHFQGVALWMRHYLPDEVAQRISF